jgi:hypothetical protein
MDATVDGESGGIIPAPVRIVTDWRRFARGLWRLPQGDIAAAYCAHRFPKLKVFTHEGRTYTNCSNLLSGIVRTLAFCYPLIAPEDYAGPQKVPHSYEGKEGHYQWQVCRLGPQVIFESSEPTVAEWQGLLRVVYSDGGRSAQSVSYREFLTERRAPKSPNERLAHAAELRLCESGPVPRTQADMRSLLAVVAATPGARHQLELSL